MKPLLAHVYEPHRVQFPCFVQPKLNGIRALYQWGAFQSRDQLPFPSGLLDHLAKPLKEVFPPDVILDGELYVHGWPLQRINSAVTPVRQEPTEDTRLVEYHVFDVVDFQSSFEARHIFADNQLPLSQVHSVVTNLVESEGVANVAYAHYVSLGYEGMMYRLGDCPYTVPKQPWDQWKPYSVGQVSTRLKYMSDQDNRCWHLLKRKDWQDDEFEFLSINETTGDLGERGFQIWCLAKNGSRFKFGSGLTHAEVDHYLANPPIGRKVKGKYLCLSQDGIPLNPTIIAIL